MLEAERAALGDKYVQAAAHVRVLQSEQRAMDVQAAQQRRQTYALESAAAERARSLDSRSLALTDWGCGLAEAERAARLPYGY